MIVSHRHRFVFVANAKTGVSSVRRALLRVLGPEDLHAALFQEVDGLRFRHLPARELRRRIGAERYDAYLSFGFVRNPWDLLVSLFHYARAQPHPVINAFSPCFAEPSRAHWEQLRETAGFDDWIRSDYFAKTPHGSQQGVFQDEAGRRIVDHVGRFETLDADFAAVCRRLGIRTRLRRHNASRREDYRAYYDAETRAMVAEIFAGDVRAFGYRF